MIKKNILLVLREFRPVLFESILKHGYQLNWNMEFYENHIPKNWHGDGIIIDNASKSEISQFPKTIPIAIRSAIVGENIFSVHGDVEHNMKIVFNFFCSRGYQHYAVLNAHPLKFDPVKYMGLLVKSAGFEYHSLYWEKQISECEDFTESIKTIKNFFISLPKPCAVYVGSIRHIHLVYRACEQAKINIPQDIAIIANTDDPGFGVNLKPSVSVLVGEFATIGEKLVEGLNGLMKGKPAPKEVQMIPATHIVARQSTDNYAVEHPETMRAINYILKNFGDSQLGMHDILQASGCSSMTLQRNFVKYLNRLPSQFLQDIRLETAAKLLEQTKLTLDQIAAKVGYGSNMSLSLAFKRKFDYAPGKYRNNYLNTTSVMKQDDTDQRP